jgi:hypothetical protein
MIGERIIATKSSYRWGYEKGDTLKVTGYGASNSFVYAVNLTRPRYGGNRTAILHRSEFKVAPSIKRGEVTKEIRILGIPIYRVYTRECNE